MSVGLHVNFAFSFSLLHMDIGMGMDMNMNMDMDMDMALGHGHGSENFARSRQHNDSWSHRRLLTIGNWPRSNRCNQEM